MSATRQRELSIGDGIAIHKPTDDVGRTRLYFTGTTGLPEFLDGCRLLDEQVRDGSASRWSVRALVPGPVSVAELGGALHGDVPIEVNLLPVRARGESATYVWVSRNSPDRSPGPDARRVFTTAVDRCLEFERNLAPRFAADIRAALERAGDAGLSIVCNDPEGRWGEDRVDGPTFTRLIGEAFYVDEATATAMLRGRGYSHLGHYLFALCDRSGELMAVFVLARWPWGFEATFTIMNAAYPGRPVVGVGPARLLMFAASALVLGRHGADTLLYGEANTANCRPCVQAGYRIHPPRLGVADPLVHENVVWADNPIGGTGAGGTPPHHGEVPYADYVLMSLDPARVLPHADRAASLLRT